MSGEFPNRDAIEAHQLAHLRALLGVLVPANGFYAAKFAEVKFSPEISSLDDFRQRAPFTFKREIVEDQERHPPYGSDLTFPLSHYTRYHQTSGSTGTPIRWLDTPESWSWMLDNWERIHRAGGTTRDDRIFFAFSFGPFLGFWTAFESAERLGCLVIAGGGMNSLARLRAILDNGATVLCCTPTYAIRLAEVAAEEKIDLRAGKVRTLSVAGEPGGSIPATRKRLEQLWPGARVYDHHGMTEVGPVSFECPTRPGVLHVIESAYLAEVIDPATEKSVAAGQVGELVLTTLGRVGSPLLRYRTGDLVKPSWSRCACGHCDLALEGGILGRTDDMIVVRGVNVYPSAVEEIVRGCGGIAEYQARVSEARALAELQIQIEPEAGCADATALARRLEKAFESALALRVPVAAVAPGTLPRFEMKARRWIRL
ncbi:MAG: AMP-binding protein [Verrucomicrobia bacterium]|nr:AMP-binding protein [Verrucomicrobiota bacterium]